MTATVEMPRYQCRKKLWALKIKEVLQAPANQECINPGGDWYLVPEEEGYAPVLVGHDDYYTKHKPEAGGFYIVYEDGYKSYSPAVAFEGWYTHVRSQDDDFEHFLSYSGLRKEEPEVIEKLRIAFYAGSSA